MQADEYMRDGMPADEARQEALRRFGNLTSMRDRTRDWTILRWVGEAVDDARLSLRVLRRHVAFSAVVIATLAIGIGATTTMLSTVYGDHGYDFYR